MKLAAILAITLAATATFAAAAPGASIDASRVDAWEFPAGTKVWKEFSYGRAIETRLIERVADGSWRFATYVWNADGTDAVLAPEGGVVVAASDAPGGRYAVPGRSASPRTRAAAC